MKKYINKIIVGVFSFALLFSAQSVLAATWNGASNDCRGISIVNATTNEGYGDPCWPASSVSADAGDTLNVRIYYHNTGTETANNTRVVLSAPTGSSGTTKSFSGSISSDQGGLSLSSVTANLSSSQTITFNSVKWYTNNTSETLTSLRGGQSGSEILNGGLDIGSIAPGWATQGSLVVSFHVSNTTEPAQLCRDNAATNYLDPLPCIYPEPVYCSINSFSASDTSITSGDSTTLSWNTNNCTSVAISQIGSVNASGTRTVSPTQTTTYTLTATRSGGATQTRSATINVNQAQSNCSINSFSASPSSITSGDSATLNWSSSNCANATISNLGYGIPVSGSQDVWPTATTTYVLTARNSAGMTTTRTATVTVNQAQNNCSINSFSASDTSITSGDSTTLSWNTNNCTSVAISQIGSVNASGTRTVSPTQTTTYTLTATRSGGATQTRSATINVNQAQSNCSINSFSASPSSITSGDSATLNWSSSNCANATISNLGYGIPVSGSQDVWPTATTTYVLTSYSSNGAQQTRTATVTVNQAQNNCSIDSFTASDTSIEDGDSVTLKWRTTDCDRVKISDIGNVSDDDEEDVTPNEDTTYTLTAYDANGSSRTKSIKIYVDENTSSDCSIDSFTSTDTSIESGDSVILKWKTTDCNDVNISGLGNVSVDGSETIYPYATTIYTLRASGDNGGTRTETLQININSSYTPWIEPVVIYNTDVVTTVATNISQTGAQVNGLITSSNYNNANVYFEYGTTVNLGMRTASRPTSGNANFSEYLTGLNSKTIYYFQAVSEGNDGVSHGAIEVFQTLGYVNVNTNTNTNTTTRTVVVQGSTVTGSTSPIMLRIENKYQAFGIGDIVDYTVYYKNISGSTLTHPMVQVFIPQGITLINSSRGTYSAEDRTLSAPIEDLVPNAEGTIYLQARVDSLDANLAQIVTTAILVYTNPNGAQENAMAYVLNNPRNMNSNLLGASAFFGNIFGLGLIGWLLLLLLILLIVLIARSYNNRRNVVTTKTEKTISQ